MLSFGIICGWGLILQGSSVQACSNAEAASAELLRYPLTAHFVQEECILFMVYVLLRICGVTTYLTTLRSIIEPRV